MDISPVLQQGIEQWNQEVAAIFSLFSRTPANKKKQAFSFLSRSETAVAGGVQEKPCRAACTERETADVKHTVVKLQSSTTIRPP